MDSLRGAISEHLTSFYPIRPTLFFTILTIFDPNDMVPAKRQRDVKGVEEDRDKQQPYAVALADWGLMALAGRKVGAGGLFSIKEAIPLFLFQSG